MDEQKISSPALPKISLVKWILVALPLVYLWLRLIDNLHLEWESNPQYGYGWMVPLLCIGLILRRLPFLPRTSEPKNFLPTFLLLFAFFAFLYLPSRLIEAAVPEWRPVQWSLAIETVGLTLCLIYFLKGKGWLRQLMIPVGFFLVAVPWPTLFEIPIIQTLTRLSAECVVEILGWVGVPTIVHGNILEVSTGMVGIDEACSGIRSFQSSLMISIFLGEFYRLTPWRRLVLIPLGFIFSFAFNVCRMSLLTYIAGTKGVGAISEYHDPAGITIAICCTLALWALAALMKKTMTKEKNPVMAETNQPFQFLNFPIVTRLSAILLAWIIIVEAGVAIWYYSREVHLQTGPEWTMNFPTDNPTLKDQPISADTRGLLRYDEAKQATWNDMDGTQWQAFYCRWLPGRVAGYLAKRHTPEICLPAIGETLVSGPNLDIVNVHGVELPVRSYVFEANGQKMQVFHCRYEAGEQNESYIAHESARFNLIRAVWTGRGNKGQRVFEIVIFGIDDPEQAKAKVTAALEKMVQVEPSTSGTAKN